MRNLQIIGEAVRALSDETRALAPEIPWSKIIGMRNVLVHGYFDIDTEIVWAAVQHDLPALKRAMKQLLKVLKERSAEEVKRLEHSVPPPKPKKPGRKKKGGEK